jgi:hypothetical protein
VPVGQIQGYRRIGSARQIFASAQELKFLASHWGSSKTDASAAYPVKLKKIFFG